MISRVVRLDPTQEKRKPIRANVAYSFLRLWSCEAMFRNRPIVVNPVAEEWPLYLGPDLRQQTENATASAMPRAPATNRVRRLMRRSVAQQHKVKKWRRSAE